MLTKYQREKANKDLKRIFSDFAESYSNLCEKSREAYMKTLPQGELIPRTGRIYGTEAKDEFKTLCAGYRAQAEAVLSGLIKDCKREATAAPAAEAVSAVTLFGMRHNITENDVADMMESYGGNPLAYSAIRSIAIDNGIKTFDEHPVIKQAETLSYLSGRLGEHLTPESAENGHTSAGFIAAVSADIDSALPAE